MKSLLCLLAMLFAVNFSYAQNTFPSTGNVGIGTTTPGAKLDIQGGVLRIGDGAGSYTGFSFNSVTGLTQENNNTVTLQGALRVNGTTGYNSYITGGNVGIGTTSPTAKLHALSSYDVNTPRVLKLFYQGSWGTATYASDFRFIDIASTEGGNIMQVNGYGIGIGYNPPAYFSPDKLYINGNVGIGTTTPDAALAVNGTIHTKEVKVDLLGWADYVFKPTYQLPKLSEVKSYIDENQHLPDMPSEAEVKKDGINLGEMVKLQTKKIEELTLYLIQENKEKKEQQAQIDQLKQQLETLFNDVRKKQ